MGRRGVMGMGVGRGEVRSMACGAAGNDCGSQSRIVVGMLKMDTAAGSGFGLLGFFDADESESFRETHGMDDIIRRCHWAERRVVQVVVIFPFVPFAAAVHVRGDAVWQRRDKSYNS